MVHELTKQWPVGTDGTNLFWLCSCECGELKIRRADHVKRGHKIREVFAAHVTHGLSRTPTYESWSAMKARCSNPNRPNWEYYGGRGIRVCERWNDFEKFVADMGLRPENTTLDRWPNPDGDYEPNNCRWVTFAEQAANKSLGTVL